MMVDTPATFFTGSCLCGSVRFRIDAPLAPVQVCHCGQCRKAQGGPFATNIPVDTATLTFTSGTDTLKAYVSSPGKSRVFCSACGSPVYSQLDKLPGVVRIRAGTLDGDLGVKPAFHAFVASKADWWDLCDGLPQFDGAAPRPTPAAHGD